MLSIHPHNTPLSVMVLPDAGRQGDRSPLSYPAGLFLGDIYAYVPFQPIYWSSHKSRRPVRSSGGAELLAAREDIGDGKILE